MAHAANRVLALALGVAAVLVTPAVRALADSASRVPQVDDSVVQAVQFDGNRLLPTATLRGAVALHAGAALTRAAVLADVAAIEARYRRIGRSVQVWPNLTHPGEGQGKPVTTLSYQLIEGASPRHYDESADPLENYYHNTLVCAAAKSGNDLCHLWLNRDGTFINFDAGEAKAGHYQVGPRRADGKVPVCQYWDTPDMVTPAEIAPRMGPPPPVAGAAPGAPGAPGASAGPAPAGMAGVMICKNQNFRSTCLRGLDPASLSEADSKLIAKGMGQRFHAGLCYPIGPRDPGDIWFEADDPLPGQLGQDKVLLIRGRQ